MKFRTLGALSLALVLGILFVGAQAWAASPPTLEVSVIGKGTVTGASNAIECGQGNLKCSTAFGSSTASATLHETHADGWSIDHWEDATGAVLCGATSSCAPPSWSGDQIVFAVFTHSGSTSLTTLGATVTQDTGVNEGRVQDNNTSYPIDCGTTGGTTGTDCSLQLVSGSTITLTATADDGYVFNSWAGACSSSNHTCSIYMAGNRAIAGNFVTAGTNTLQVAVSGAGNVTGGGMNCSSGAVCTLEEPSNAKVKLTATPADGYAFTGWGGDCAGIQSTCTVEMSTDHTNITATFTQVVPVLLTVSGAGTIAGSGMSCGPGPATCEGDAAPDTTIEFTASPTTIGGSVSWIGCTTASGTLCTVEVGTDPVAVTANFSGTTTGGGGGSFVQLTVSVTGNGYVSTLSGPAIWCTAAGGSGCVASVQQNTSVQLRATSASGATTDFQGWGGSCISGLSTTCTLLMSSAKSASANFVGSSSTFTLTGSVSGSGSISGGGLKCSTPGGSGCSSPQAADARISLTATANAGSTFTSWSGGCTGTSPACSVLMSSNQTVTANFTTSETGGGGGGGSSSDTLSLSVTGGGTVTAGTAKCTSTGTKVKLCSDSVTDGAPLVLKATPSKGYKFAGWKGACTGAKPTCTTTPNDNVSVSATFKALPIAAAAKKPTIAKLRTGFRVTISFLAGEAGKVTVTTKPKTTRLTKTVKVGANVVRFTVKKHGTYTFTVSLRSKTGVHALHYRIKV